LNTQVKLFDDKRVRQAFNYAVNKEAIVREITKMGSLPATGALPPGMHGYDPDLPGYAYDPVKAKRLLAEADFPNGTGFPVIQLWTVSKAESTQAELAAHQCSLAELGVTLESHFTDDWTRYTDLLRRGELQMFRYASYAGHSYPDNFLFPLLYSTGQANYWATAIPESISSWSRLARKTIMPGGSPSTVRQNALSWRMRPGSRSITTALSTSTSRMCTASKSASWAIAGSR
jgi:ABC-type transport system substrate-binding protein